MKKILLTALLIVSVVLMISMVACNNLSKSSDYGGFPAVQLDTKDGHKVFYVEASDLDYRSGTNPSPQESAMTIWNTVKSTLGDLLSDIKNFYLTLSAVDSVNSEDSYIFYLGAGSEFEKGDYILLYNLAVNYRGSVYYMSDESGQWEPWDSAQAKRGDGMSPARPGDGDDEVDGEDEGDDDNTDDDMDREE